MYGDIISWVKRLKDSKIEDVTAEDIRNEIKRIRGVGPYKYQAQKREAKAAEEATLQQSPEAFKRRAGRPVGSTKAAKRAKVALKEKMTVKIVNDYRQIQLESKGRVRKGVLDSMIHVTNTRHDLDIKKNAVLTRLNRKQTTPVSNGGKPVLTADFEDMIVAFLNALADSKQPYNNYQALALVNGFVKGTPIAIHIRKYKLKHCRGSLKFTTPLGELSMQWFKRFMNRNEARLTCKKGERFSNNRSDWCTYRNFSGWYRDYHKALVDAGIARLLETPYFADRDGKPCEENDPACVGLKIELEILDPSFMVFMDESGINTNQKTDNYDFKYLCRPGATPKYSVATSDHRGTVIPWTLGTGEPLNCTVIFQSDSDDGEIPESWGTGIDLRVNSDSIQWKENGELDLDANTGDGKLLPGAPTCRVNGTSVPPRLYTTKHGGVTGEIILDSLKAFDELNIFDRSTGKIPVLLVDGHLSRLHLELLEYIEQPDTRWIIVFGVPYGTNFWQQADAKQCLGVFKRVWTIEKDLLIKHKYSLGFMIGFCKPDIIPLVNRAWQKTFENIDALRHAMAERGLNPLNRACLKIPEIAATKGDNALDPDGRSEEENELIRQNLGLINNESETSQQAFDIIKQHVAREDAKTQNRSNKLKEGVELKNALVGLKKLTTGAYIRQGGHRVTDELRQALVERRNAKAAKDAATAANKQSNMEKNLALARDGYTQHGVDFDKWNQKELGGMYQIVKDKEDGKKPTTKPGLVSKIEEIGRRFVKDNKLWPPTIVTLTEDFENVEDEAVI